MAGKTAALGLGGMWGDCFSEEVVVRNREELGSKNCLGVAYTRRKLQGNVYILNNLEKHLSKSIW